MAKLDIFHTIPIIIRIIKQYCIEDVEAKIEEDYSDTLRNVQNMYESFIIVFHIIHFILLSTIKNPQNKIYEQNTDQNSISNEPNIRNDHLDYKSKQFNRIIL